MPARRGRRDPSDKTDPAAVAEAAAAEARVRGQIPDEQFHAGRFQLADLERLAEKIGLERGNRAATIRRLVGAGLATSRVDQPPTGGRTRFFSSEDALSILTACQLMREEKLTPASAAARVIQLRRSRGHFAGSQALNTLMEVALARFHRHVVGRLVTALLAAVGMRRLQPGSIVLIESAPERPTEIDSAWAEARIRERARRPGTAIFAMIGETRETFFVGDLPDRMLDHRVYRAMSFPEDAPEYIVMIAANEDGAPEAATTSADAALTRALFHAVLPGYDAFHRLATAKPPPDIVTLDASAELTLWLASLFACVVSLPSAPERAHCLILTTQIDPHTGKPRLRAITSSDEPPWHENQEARVYLQSGQLLSGYASLVNVPLSVDRADPPRNQFVTQLAAERKLLEGETPGCVAIPIPARDSSGPAALYVFMRAEDLNVGPVVGVLRVLAPIVGELIQRNADASRTTEYLIDGTAARFQPVAEFAAAANREIVTMLEADQRARRQREPDDRLGFIVLDAASGRSPFGRDASTWLRGQLPFVTARVLLSPWLRIIGGAASLSDLDLTRAVYGELGQGASVLLIPRVLRKNELDLLRGALPKQMNQLPGAVTDSNEVATRLNVWLMDVRWERMVAAWHKGGLDAEVDRALDRARAAARVLTHIIDAYTFGFVKGEWLTALKSARAGLSVQEDNPYLLRRAAEYSIYEDDFPGAEDYARKALAQESSISAFCLLGDALLGQGKLEEAELAFDEAAKIDRRNPLPEYSRAFARLTVASVLRAEVNRRAMEFIRSATGGRAKAAVDLPALEIVDDHARDLASSAAASFSRAEELLGNWDALGPQAERRLHESAVAFGLFQCEMVANNPERAIQSLLAATKVDPRDNLLQRQLTLVRVSKDPAVRETLLLRYAKRARRTPTT